MSDQRHGPKADGAVVAGDKHVLFVFSVVAGAIVLRDLDVKASIILIYAVFMAVLFENRDARACVRWVLFTAVSVFFREVTAVGTENIPRDDPVVLVCAPHANQFLDPATVCYLLPQDMYTRGRRVGWLVAAKSWRRRLVGFMSRLMDGVPVERPQDIALVGDGLLVLSDKEPQQLRGLGTRFTSQNIKAGDAIVVKIPPPSGVKPDIGRSSGLKTYSFAVVHVESDTVLRIKQPVQEGCNTPDGVKFKVQPRVTQTEVFRFCHNSLGRGDCIGIFPEGGSHDRSHFLPIKSGVSVIALGAMAKYPHRNVRIVPVGLNYFNGHRFRSRALVGFGDPIDIPKELCADYRAGLPQPGSGRILRSKDAKLRLVGGTTADLSVGDTLHVQVGKSVGLTRNEKRSVIEEIISDTEATLTTPLWDAAEYDKATADVEYTFTSLAGKKRQHKACDDLLVDITNALETVTVNAPDHKVLKDVWTARTLYKPSRQKLSAAQTTELTRKMLEAYKLAQSTDESGSPRFPEMKPEIDRVTKRVREYQTLLGDYGLRDWQVVHSEDTKELLLQPFELFHRLVSQVVMLVVYTLFLMGPGLLAAPVLILARRIATKEAKKAVAGSEVKLEGKDVLATFKVMTWMVMGPLSVIFYAIVATYLFDTNIGLMTMLLLPPLGQQAIYASDSWRDLYRSLKPLYLALWKDSSQVDDLITLRREVQRDVRELVKKFGTKLNIEPMEGLEWRKGGAKNGGNGSSGGGSATPTPGPLASMVRSMSFDRLTGGGVPAETKKHE
jgi:1-acyl-sn-glycerol-3-phosphate acyltransferase